MLEIQNLSFSYDGDVKVLDSINLKISQGEIVTITGPTGSGKSTLAKCLAGFIPRSIKGKFTGTILIDGKDTSFLSIAEISRNISLVQQDPDSQICTLRVIDEVAFGPENYGFAVEAIGNLVDSTLAEVDSTHLRLRPTYAISGGEKQRVAIASMLSCQSSYIIFDEPSSSLDPKGINSLRKILLGLKERNIGVVCIEHNLDVLRQISDRTLVMSDGMISEWHHTDIPQVTNQQKIPVFKENCLLSMKNVSFSYGPNKIIRDLDLEICEGEIIAVLGENGAGKTTLISLLGGLLQPDSGRIFIENQPIHTMNRKAIVERISIVFQNPNHQIFERSVWREQTLTIGILDCETDEAIQRADELLNAADLNGLKERNPFSLSHGQKRRLNISSVSVHSPKILLLDEPFIGQDPKGRNFILRLLIETAEAGGVSLVVTHDPNFVKNHCNRAIFLENKSILLDGSPEMIFQRLKEIGHSEFVGLEVE